jgi:uracil-DNA glycosylase
MDWISAVPFFESEKFERIVTFLKEERNNGKTVLPKKENLLRAFALTPFEEVKVVILGQDPYPNEEHACGLAFAVPPNTPLPKSLVNIYNELKNDVVFNSGFDLTEWAKQGVLLLNTSLSVVAGNPASHSDIGWGALTNDVIRVLNEERDNLVFILWGKHAQRKAMFIDETKHLVIKSPHPSPLSAHRGFFGSKPFSRTNTYLKEHNIEPIRW